MKRAYDSGNLIYRLRPGPLPTMHFLERNTTRSKYSVYGYLEPARLTQLSARVLLSVVAEEHEVVGRQV